MKGGNNFCSVIQCFLKFFKILHGFVIFLEDERTNKKTKNQTDRLTDLCIKASSLILSLTSAQLSPSLFDCIFVSV